MRNKREYAEANRQWFIRKAAEESIQALPKGIYYKVLSPGKADGRHPGPRDIVSVYYTGMTIDGKTFDGNTGSVPAVFRLCDLIEGWIVAIGHMTVGDKWEIYIPAEMGYGRFSQPGIPAGSTLIFQIELINIT